VNISEPSRGNNNLVAEYIRKADHVLIGAGAGLSAAAGIDYGDTQIFAKLFPQLVKKGFRRQYELIGYNPWSEGEKWAYWATHVNYVRFQFPPSQLYATLLKNITEKDYFIITTNVEAMFHKTGFAADRIYTPQGDYARLQCVKPCTTETWPSKPVIDNILPSIDAETFTVTDLGFIPRCPRCGGRVFLNVHLDSGYNAEPYKEQLHRYQSWLQIAANEELLIVELGVGFNSPGVIRWPFERMVQLLPHVQFIRINAKNADVPVDIKNKSISIKEDIKDVLLALPLLRTSTGNPHLNPVSKNV
jgi:NAD-dependent SIR2 family protein deacetylase